MAPIRFQAGAGSSPGANRSRSGNKLPGRTAASYHLGGKKPADSQRLALVLAFGKRYLIIKLLKIPAAGANEIRRRAAIAGLDRR
jgi:hypothetical protein